jgi:hypothetical protein
MPSQSALQDSFAGSIRSKTHSKTPSKKSAFQDALQDDAVRSLDSGTGGLLLASSLDLVARYVCISLAIVDRFFMERQVRFCYSAFFNHPPFSSR